MKIKKLIKLLECIEGNAEGKLPRDMYRLGTYTRNNDQEIPITEMDFVHVIRAFQNLIDTEYDQGLEVSVAQTNMITKLEQRVSHLLSRNVYLQDRVDELTPKKATPKYDFCEVPNDCEGQEFIDNVKKYLNTNKYKMRVRGQHVKDEYKGTGATSYGQNIDQSTHLRVYIEEK
jgi:hypothetical protein|tara:strand:+ start:1273 stop:1794 length:522 start_codon:yes stop_codon:yes gene_type:complete